MTENGWPPDTGRFPDVSISLDQCVQVTIPGSQETLWFQKGAPAVLLPAFAAAMNQYIEPLINSQGYNDEGTWTNGNSVGTSNHLGATAMDYNWSDHPMGPAPEDPAAGWQGSTLIDGDEVPGIRELLNFCEGTIFWGGDWTTPKDSMHFQVGYNTFDPATGGAQQWVKDFIARKIGPDGKLTWTPSWLTPAPTPTPQPAPAPAPAPDPPVTDAATTALYDAVPVIDEDRASQLVDAVMAGLALAQCTNVKRIAMWLAQIGEESGGFVYTEEIAKDGPYAPYIGRTWIQITWESNYAAFGQWAATQGLIDDPDYFVNNPTALADLKWAGIGPAWYWTVARPTINSLCDQGDVVGVTQLINGGQNGIDDRAARYNQAVALGDELLSLIAASTPAPAPAPSPTPSGVITLADVSQDEWEQLVADVKEIRAQLNGDGIFAQTGSDANAVAALDATKKSGKPMSLLDMVAWIKNHVSTHQAPTP